MTITVIVNGRMGVITMARFEYSVRLKSKYNGLESSYPCFGKTWKSALSHLLARIGGRESFDVLWVYDYQNAEKITETKAKKIYKEKFIFTIELLGGSITNNRNGKTIKIDSDDCFALQSLLMETESVRKSDEIIERFTINCWDDETTDDDDRSNGRWQASFNRD